MREEMNTREKKLQVKDLTISFRTINGKLQAVRDISFDLYKGETLAIVGESGSGKSATSKTILGISAPNTIIESGEILYDGKDLLKISEDDYHEIRGDKISMIFQDPLSSLNPVMRIGNQITEAMLLKNKANRRESKKKLNAILKKLALVLKETDSKEDDKRFDTFKKIIGVQSKYEAPYEQALSNAKGGLKAAEDMLLSISKEAITNPVSETKELEEYLRASIDRFVVRDANAMKEAISGIQKAAHEGAKSKNYDALKEQVEKAKAILEKVLENETPDFFALGCYIVLGNNSLEDENSGELNIKTRPYVESKFMQDFKSDIHKALVSSAKSSSEGMKLAIVELREASKKLSAEMPERAEALKYAKEISDKVEAGIDPFETVKNSFSYTFRVSLTSAINVYYDDIVRNAAEEKRFERQSARYARLEAKGKAPEAAVAPLSLSDLSLVQANIIKILDNMADQYESQIEIAKAYDFDKRTETFINWLRETAMGCFRVITKSMAKDRAIRVMEQVGITEARKRYRQYPFEFSGGMRQRIVT